MSTKKTTTKKTSAKKAPKAEAAKKAPAKKAVKKNAAKAKAPRKREGKLSALDAAAQVLANAKEPMNAKTMIEAMAAQGLWQSPGGQTPHATLYAAILREINDKGAEARFQKVDRGQFTLQGMGANAKAAPKTKPAAKAKATGKKGKQTDQTKPADGTPGPKAVSDLFKI